MQTDRTAHRGHLRLVGQDERRVSPGELRDLEGDIEQRLAFVLDELVAQLPPTSSLHQDMTDWADNLKGQSALRGFRPGGLTGDLDGQERAAWSIIARAAEMASASLSPHHPERPEFVTMADECRAAAGEKVALAEA